MAPARSNALLPSEASNIAAAKWEQQRPGPVASKSGNAAIANVACQESFDRARGCPEAVCRSGFYPRLPSEGKGVAPAIMSPTPEITPETRASWADASAWEDSSTQSGSSPRGACALASKQERTSPEKAPRLNAGACEIRQHSQEEDATAKKSKRSHRRRRRHRAAGSMLDEADDCGTEMQARGPPNVVTLGDLGFDLDANGTLRDAPIPTVSMSAPAATTAASTSPSLRQGWVPVASPCRSGGLAARPQPMPLSTGISTLAGLPEAYPVSPMPVSPMKRMRDASTRQALASCTVGPWSAPGAPPGNLSPVHGNSLAVRAPSLSIEVCATTPAPASTQPTTPGTQSPHFRSRIMSTQPIAQPHVGDSIMSTQPPQVGADLNQDGASPKKPPAGPAWSPAGTPQADVLRSWLHASGLNVHGDLADQLRAAAPEIYED